MPGQTLPFVTSQASLTYKKKDLEIPRGIKAVAEMSAFFKLGIHKRQYLLPEILALVFVLGVRIHRLPEIPFCDSVCLPPPKLYPK